MSYEFVDRVMEQTKTGAVRSPVSHTLDVRLVASPGIRGAFDPTSYISAQAGSNE